MRKEWMTANELAGIGGLPKSPQGVNTRARSEGWVKRKRTGVKGGKAVEYDLNSIPEDTKKLIESDIYGASSTHSTQSIPQHDETLSMWDALLNSVSQEKRELLLNHALANGMSSIIPNEVSNRAIKIAQLIETLSEDDQREILQLIEIKKLGALLDNNSERKKA